MILKRKHLDSRRIQFCQGYGRNCVEATMDKFNEEIILKSLNGIKI